MTVMASQKMDVKPHDPAVCYSKDLSREHIPISIPCLWYSQFTIAVNDHLNAIHILKYSVWSGARLPKAADDVFYP